MSMRQDLEVAKGLEVRGSFLCCHEFGLAVALISDGRADVVPLVTQEFDFERASEPFDVAGDRTRATKIQLVFSGLSGL
jgi:L-idonate 5-dehydrogenase